MINTIKKEWQAQIAIIYFIAITIWWFIAPSFKTSPDARFLGDQGSIYFLIAIWGAPWGFIVARKWGGLKSVMGKAITFFSLGLVGQIFGQFAYGYYPFVLHQSAPYPALGDVGYFGSIPFYILGIYHLALASGVKIRLQSYMQKARAFLLPLALLVGSYFLFLQGYKFDWTNPIRIFLDFGYPLGQALYVSLAFLTYLLSKGILGGVMKNKILFVLLALFVQFFSDYTFLYQTSKGTYIVGGSSDYLYFIAYFLMTLALLQFKTAYDHLRSK